MNHYTTRTGVQIGIAYQKPPPRELGTEAERIQSALLKPVPVGWPWWFRVWHWLAGPR